MKSDVIWKDLPFEEAIAFFQAKLNVPTRHWDDLWRGMHSRAFMVAGAMEEDMLGDFNAAIERALKDGTTLRDFQKSFDKTVENTGWSYHGTRAWRTGLIYNTNLTTAYSAGRWKQMTDPEVLKLRPYLGYRHGDSVNPRPEHLAWDGLVLPADDPWWNTHYPPNGWGCHCSAFSLSQRDLDGMGKAGPDTAPEGGTYEWTDRRGTTHTIPKGIDPGWDYNCGKAAYDNIPGMPGAGNASKKVTPPPPPSSRFKKAVPATFKEVTGPGVQHPLKSLPRSATLYPRPCAFMSRHIPHRNILR